MIQINFSLLNLITEPAGLAVKLYTCTREFSSNLEGSQAILRVFVAFGNPSFQVPGYYFI
jgi:hypothetical protein